MLADGSSTVSECRTDRLNSPPHNWWFKSVFESAGHLLDTIPVSCDHYRKSRKTHLLVVISSGFLGNLTMSYEYGGF